MDGNRTHPGRLNSAPQTVWKTLVVVLNSEPAQVSPQDRHRAETLDTSTERRAPNQVVRHPRLSAMGEEEERRFDPPVDVGFFGEPELAEDRVYVLLHGAFRQTQ
jgi:hypothetical protein